MTGRPLRGFEPMKRISLHVPIAAHEKLQAYAVKLAVQEGKPVTVAEAARRILERSLNRMELP